MNQFNYSYLDEAYQQTNLINKNNINIKIVENKTNIKKSNWFNRIGNFFRSLCCCLSNNNDNNDDNNNKSDNKSDNKKSDNKSDNKKSDNDNNNDISDDKTIVEINLREIIEPYIDKFINNCWQGIRTKDFYRDYDFVQKNNNEKIVYYIYEKKNIDEIQNITKDSKLIVNKLENKDLLDYNKIRDNSDKEVQQKYNIKSIEHATKMFQNYMKNRDNVAFIAYIFEMDRKGYKIVKKNIEIKN